MRTGTLSVRIFRSDILVVHSVCYTGIIREAFTLSPRIQMRPVDRYYSQVQTMCKWQVFITPTQSTRTSFEVEENACAETTRQQTASNVIFTYTEGKRYATVYSYVVQQGAFTKLRRSTASFVMPACPSVCMEELCTHWTDFYEI